MGLSSIAAAAIMAPFVLGTAATAAENAVLGASIFCNTADDVREYIQASDDPRAFDHFRGSCVAAAARYYEHEEVRVIQERMASFRILRVTVTGVFSNGVLLGTQPHDKYLAVRVQGMDV